MKVIYVLSCQFFNSVTLTLFLHFRVGLCIELGTARLHSGIAKRSTEDPDVEKSISRETYDKLSSLPGQNECGISGEKTGRIVGGEPAKLGAWPWIAAMGKRVGFDRYFFFCGATLISTRYAISAAHCVAPFGGSAEEEGLVLRVGDLDLNSEVQDGAKPVNVDIKSFKTHKRYTEAWNGFDISLLTLKNDVEFNDLVRPICLPLRNEFYAQEFEGYQPFVAGWGLTAESGEQSSMLLQVQMPMLSWKECADLIGSHGSGLRLHQDSVCTLAEGKDACQGDSGGPLMFPMDGKYYLYGVVSYGEGCARPDNPGVFNKVHSHMKWIASILD